MTPRERSVTVRIDADLMEGIREYHERYGTGISEQIRRALRAWLEAQGVIKRAGRKRAATRRRP